VLFEATAYVIPSRFLSFGLLIIASSAIALTGCKGLDNAFCSGGGCEWTAQEWARIQTLSPLPDPPLDDSNQYVGMEAAIKLGQEFYFETQFSGNATLTDAIGQDVPYALPGTIWPCVILHLLVASPILWWARRARERSSVHLQHL